MKKILQIALLPIFLSTFAVADLVMHVGKLQDEDWYVDENFVLLEANMKDWKKAKYQHKLGTCGVTVNWAFFIRAVEPELMNEFIEDTKNKSMRTVKKYAEKCVEAVDRVENQEEKSRKIYDVIIENLPKTGLIEEKNIRLLTDD